MILGVHPGANVSWIGEKRWPAERFSRVSERFIDEYNGDVIVFGGPDDKSVIEKVKANIKKKRIHFADNQTIRQTAALIKECDLFLTNDSGLMHVAAACKVPIVAIFGPTLPYKNYPWKIPHLIVRENLPCSPCYNHRRIKCKHYDCLNLLSEEKVYLAVKDMICKMTEKEHLKKSLDKTYV